MSALVHLLLPWLLGATVLLQSPGSSPSTPRGRGDQPADAARPARTDAERIADLRDAIARGKKAIDTLLQRIDDPTGEYARAEADFEGFDKKLKERRLAVTRLKKDGMLADAAKAEAELKTFQEEWQLAKDRFDLAIRERKLSQEAVAGLRLRVAKDQEALDRLEGRTPAELPPAVKPAAGAPPAAAPAADPALPPLPGVPAAVTQAVAPAVAVPPSPLDNDRQVRKAREVLAQKQAELKTAEDRGRIADDRVRNAERSVKTIGQMLQLETEAIAQVEKAVAKLTDIIRNRPPADPDERSALGERLVDAEARLLASKERAKRLAERLAGYHQTMKELKADLADAEAAVETARAAVEAADDDLADLLSPVNPRNLALWAGRHGPNLLLILAGMVTLHLVARQFSRQIVRLVVRNGDRGSDEDRENRAHTLVGVFRYAAGLAVFGGGLVMFLDEAGVPIVPLMGGAAVLGLAVAFGAQNLIKDYFTGFMMLLEDQYSVNDVVRVGKVCGVVEAITLRMTVVRDLEGVRHFLPHGAITEVSNLTHGWSRALFDVGVAYKEDVDRVMDLLVELGRGMRLDPAFAAFILDDPEMLGVDAFTESAVVVRFFLKTRPLKQWAVKRELLRRIKRRFDEEGIEIPFPCRTVYHRVEGGEAGPKLSAEDFKRAA